MYNLQRTFSPATFSKLLCNYLILSTMFVKSMYTYSLPTANGNCGSAALGDVGFWRYAKSRFCSSLVSSSRQLQAEVCSDKPGYELK